MEPYPKIDSLFVRNETTHKFTTDRTFKNPAVEYLQNNKWIWTEKIHGTNVRIIWDGEAVVIGGRTPAAQMSTDLFLTITKLFPAEHFREHYPDTPMCLYGEGYGAGIQKGGKYSPHKSIRIFDIKIDTWWLKWADIDDICEHLGVSLVPIVGEGTIHEAIEKLLGTTPDTPRGIIAKPLQSQWGDFLAEGLVLRCPADLVDRRGKRILVKLKHNDF